MQDKNPGVRTTARRKTKGSCIWQASGVVSAQTCESRPDDCEGCPVYTSLAKVAAHRQTSYFGRDYFDWCSVNACAVPGRPCPFAGPCMANWSRTNSPALRMLTLTGIGGLAIGANASLIQQTGRRPGLHADLLSRLFELRKLGKSGAEDKLSPADLGLRTTREQFALLAAASFLDCLDSVDVFAFAETMFEHALLPCGLSGSFSGERTEQDRWDALWALQGLALLDVLSTFDIDAIGRMQTTMASSSYPSMVMAHMALAVQRCIQPYTYRAPGLEPETVARAVTLVGFARGLLGKAYKGRLTTSSELAAAVIVARTLGAVSEGGAVPAGRVLMDETLRMLAAGSLDVVWVQLMLSGIVASGLEICPDERTAISRAVLRSFQRRFRKLGDMRNDPVSLLASLGADNLVRESDRFEALAGAQVPSVELDPELLGCEMPGDRFYCRGHVWVQPGGDGVVRIGLDDLVAHLIGRLDAVEMPEPGKRLRRNKPVLRLIRGGESVDVRSPMNADVAVVNRSIVDSPGLLADRPYDDGWLLAVRPVVSEEDLSGLMFGGIARDWQRAEAGRLGSAFQGKIATAADGATLARDALAGIPGVRWSKVLRKFLMG
ncbi:MAG: hypothetical protein JXP73_18375 [Deltaproteobacteria bacterium]|nr:hypothetical protein [Deltaproteobacteria bacterium]